MAHEQVITLKIGVPEEVPGTGILTLQHKRRGEYRLFIKHCGASEHDKAWRPERERRRRDSGAA